MWVPISTDPHSTGCDNSSRNMSSSPPLSDEPHIEAPPPATPSQAAAPTPVTSLGRSALWAGIHGMVVSTSVGQVLPVLMTTLNSELYLSVTQAGLLAAADLGAATAASAVC